MRIIADYSADGCRLDKYLTLILQDEHAGITRSKIKRMIDENCVQVNKEKVKAGFLLKLNDEIEFELMQEKPLNAEPQDIPLNVVYEDDDIIIINKQQGLVVHPCSSTRDGTLVNALLFRNEKLSNINGELRPGIVHRIDKDTSGLLVVAKNDVAHVKLAKQIEIKECRRIYLALCVGNFKETNGVIQTYIGRDKHDRKKMAVVNANEGKLATTYFSVLESFNGASLLEFELKTGRTHQIRVHANYIGHHIIGDKTYGNGKEKITWVGGQLLHATKLILTHPTMNKVLTFTAELPTYFEEILEKYRKMTRK